MIWPASAVRSCPRRSCHIVCSTSRPRWPLTHRPSSMISPPHRPVPAPARRHRPAPADRHRRPAAAHRPRSASLPATSSSLLNTVVHGPCLVHPLTSAHPPRYFCQDDDAGRRMTQTLATLPSSQRAPFSRLQASIRSAYHRSVNARRHAEFQAHLSATMPGGSLIAHARSDPRSHVAQKGRRYVLVRTRLIRQNATSVWNALFAAGAIWACRAPSHFLRRKYFLCFSAPTDRPQTVGHLPATSSSHRPRRRWQTSHRLGAR